MRCGGLEGCPIKKRSGGLHCDWLTPIGMPDELEARIVVSGVSASMSANNLILKSGLSGPFSWTRSTPSSASLNLVVNESRSFEAPADSPNCSRAGQALLTYSRRFSSAFGAGSVATTSRPCARNRAAQLAPMTPVPTIAIRRIGLSEDISVSPLLFSDTSHFQSTKLGHAIQDRSAKDMTYS